ncbi:MAG: SDR family oxidoreductase, partial [Candidatus Hydrogenedentota bacterium]
MFRLDDKIAVITGGGSGIGQAMCHVFAQQGATVCILEVNADQANETLSQLQENGLAASVYACDVASQASVDDAIASVVADHGRIDILINNAGISHVGTVETTTEEELDRVYSVNIKGIYTCSHAVVPIMKKQGGGCILNMASIASLIGLKDRFAYGMSKGAVLTMTYSIAVDYVGDNIRCNCIAPARVHTPFVDGFIKKNYPGNEEEMFKQLSEYQPIGRMGKPEEVAQLAVYLCSDEASFITGQAYPIDGGVLMQ